MAEKSVPISVRISLDDAEFLAGLISPGSVTPSDKIRALIAQAKKQRFAASDLDSAVEVARSLLSETQRIVRDHERTTKTHSEVLAAMLEWLPETFAQLMVVASSNTEPNSQGEKSRPSGEVLAHTIEADLLGRVSSLCERMLKMTLTAERSSYRSSDLIARSVELIALAKIVEPIVVSKKEKV